MRGTGLTSITLESMPVQPFVAVPVNVYVVVAEGVTEIALPDKLPGIHE